MEKNWLELHDGTLGHDLSMLELVHLQQQIDDLRKKILDELDARSRPPNQTDARLIVNELLKSRRRRERVFECDYFSDPAWEVLLELYAAELVDRKLSITGACYSTTVPASTALRWLDRLENSGLIRRSADPSDRRRTWLFLTDRASSAMKSYIESLPLRPV